MPQPEHLKGIASAAVAGAERLVFSYPTRFSDIEAAKTYIGTICTKNGYTYGIKLALSPEDETYVKDRVHFLVATKAFQQGEFYLDTPLPDRAALRKAVEADIQRVLQLIQCWPQHFFDVNMALNYVSSACTLAQFSYTPFEGVAPDKFRRYVHFNTARNAFQKGVFEMRWLPGEWVEKGKSKQQKQLQRSAPVVLVLKPLGTLMETIKADISRLMPLLPPWHPSFSSLNAARNFVSQAAFELHFRYTGWPDLEAHRFRLFVNFNTAKDAWLAGRFAVEEMEVKKDEDEEGSNTSSSTLFEEKLEQTDTPLLTRNWRACVDGHAGTVTSAPGSMATNVDATDPPPATSINETPDPSNLLGENLLLDHEMEQLPDAQDSFDKLVAVTRDPFKVLLSEFGRVGVLKAAFE